MNKPLIWIETRKKVEEVKRRKEKARALVLQSQDLRVGQEKEPCIGFTQENSIENLVQDYLSYILKAYDLYPTILAYPK